ncbi:unnamed protein product, partial [Adineta ricciae]
MLDETSTKLQHQSHIVQNYILAWFDPHTEDDVQYRQNTISELRNVVNSISIFNDIDQCIDFVTDIEQEKVFMIVSNCSTQQLMTVIHDLSQINSVYVFDYNRTESRLSTKQWTKTRGPFTDISELCESIKLDARRCDYNMASISIIRTAQSLDRGLDELDQSFMYSQLLKDILLDMDHGEDAKQIFVEFCRQQHHDNVAQLNIINEFEREYRMHTPIWWYTRDCFLY